MTADQCSTFWTRSSKTELHISKPGPGREGLHCVHGLNGLHGLHALLGFCGLHDLRGLYGFLGLHGLLVSLVFVARPP